jgi:hypothetical protein
MATELLIYEKVVALSPERHLGLSVQPSVDFAYSAKLNSVPLMAAEFPHAAGEYPIAFVPSAETVSPIILLGLHNEQNLYLDEQAHWRARYIPAFIRRYPFVFAPASKNGKASDGAGNRMVVGLDEAYPGLNRQGQGERLFDDQAEPTAYVQGVLKFLTDYHLQTQRTAAFCSKLHHKGLLDPIEASISSPSGEKLALHGLMAVNRDRLRSLPGDELEKLVETDELELIYLHLHSMRNLAALAGRLTAAKSVRPPKRDGEQQLTRTNGSRRGKDK